MEFLECDIQVHTVYFKHILGAACALKASLMHQMEL